MSINFWAQFPGFMVNRMVVAYQGHFRFCRDHLLKKNPLEKVVNQLLHIHVVDLVNEYWEFIHIPLTSDGTSDQ